MSDAFRPDIGASWEILLADPAAGTHFAQLYTERDFLVDAVTRFAGEGLRRGEAVLLVTMADHGSAIVRRLEKEGLPVAALERRGQLVVLDADETLSSVLQGRVPHPARFRAVIGEAVAGAKRAGYPAVRVFGEIVDLLRRESIAAAIRLETLWNELLDAEGIVLLCGYSLDVFDPEIYEGLVQEVASVHSHLVPVPDYARLDRAVERAYTEVFGTEVDGKLLRRGFLAHYARPAAMPDAEAAILAAREFAPDTAAMALLDRARRHYRKGPATAA
jgi:hypothetical protein